MKKGYRLVCIGYAETSNVTTDNIRNWSSSEYNSYNAYYVNFNSNGNMNLNNNNKTNSFRVRPVVAFTTKPITTR